LSPAKSDTWAIFSFAWSHNKITCMHTYKCRMQCNGLQEKLIEGTVSNLFCGHKLRLYTIVYKVKFMFWKYRSAQRGV